MGQYTTDVDRRSHNLRHFHPGMGLYLGYTSFPHCQNNSDSSDAYVLRSEREDKCVSCGSAHKDRFCVFLHVCDQQNGNIPNWSFMADNGITQEGTGVLGSPSIICV